MKFNRFLLAVFAASVLINPVFADAPTQQHTIVSQQSTLININEASANDLMKLSGMTNSKARSIVSYRKKNGPFKSLDELTNVKGFTRIKSEALKIIQDQLKV